MTINIAAPQSVVQSPESRQPTFKDYLIVFARGKWVLLAVFSIVLLAAFLYTYLTPKTYEATARVLVDVKGREGIPSFFDLFGTTLNTKSTNELEVLGSSSLAQTVADVLLQQRYLEYDGIKIIPILLEQANSKNNHAQADREAIAERVRLATEFLPVKDSEVIKITTRSHDPREAALVANTYAEQYTARNLTQSRSRSRAVREFLEQQLQVKKRNLEDAERTLQDYMRQSGVVTLDTEVRKVVDQLSQLEATRDGLDVELTSRLKMLAIYEQELSQQGPRAERIVTEYNDTYIKMLQEQLARLEVQRDVIIAQNPGITSDETYAPKLAEINGQISALRKNLDQRTKQFLDNIVPGDRGVTSGEVTGNFLGAMKEKILERQIEIEGVRARKAALSNVIVDYEQEFKRIPEKSVELAKRQRAHLSAEKLYLFVEEKYNEASIKEKAELGSASIVDRAVIPTIPVSPRLLFNLILGALAGLGLGVAVVLLRSELVAKVNSPEDLARNEYVPLTTVRRMAFAGLPRGATMAIPSHGRMLDIHLVTHLYPYSSSAEAFRHLRTGLEFGYPERPLKLIEVTSPNRGDGKTVTAANLALAYAQAEKNVLLVDADLRRPRLHTLFELPNDPGLADVLAHGKHPVEVIISRVLPNLDVLPSGSSPKHPFEILGSKRMQQFLGDISKLYDVVVFDTASLLPVTDASVLAARVDGTVIVVSAGETALTALDRSRELLEQVGANILGIVLNRFNIQKAYGGYSSKNTAGYFNTDGDYHQTPGNAEASHRSI